MPLSSEQDRASADLCRSFLITAATSGADYATEYGALVALVVNMCLRPGCNAHAMAQAFAQTVEQEIIFAGPAAGSA